MDSLFNFSFPQPPSDKPTDPKNSSKAEDSSVIPEIAKQTLGDPNAYPGLPASKKASPGMNYAKVVGGPAKKSSPPSNAPNYSAVLKKNLSTTAPKQSHSTPAQPVHPKPLSYSTLLQNATYSKSKRIPSAKIQSDLAPLSTSNHHYYNPKIKAALAKDNLPLAQKLLKELAAIDTPNLFSYQPFLTYYAQKKDKAQFDQILSTMNQLGIKRDGISYNIELTLLVNLGDFKQIEAFIFKKIPNHLLSTSTFSTFLKYLANHPNLPLPKMLDILKNKNLEPDNFFLNTLMDCHVRRNQIDQAKEILQMMKNEGISPDSTTYSILLNYSVKHSKEEKDILPLLQDMIEQKIPLNEILLTTLLNFYIEKKDEKKATATFEALVKNDLPVSKGCFQTLMGYYYQVKAYDKMQGLWDRLEQFQLEPSELMYTHMLNKGLQTKDPELIQNLLLGISIEQMENDEILQNAILKCYHAFQNSQDAYSLFSTLKNSTVRNYGLMIHLLVKDNKIEQAYQLLDEMSKNAISPSYVVYSPLLDYYLKKEDTEQFQKILQKLAELNIEHTTLTSINLFMDLLIRKEKFEEAEKLIHTYYSNFLKPTIGKNGERSYDLHDLSHGAAYSLLRVILKAEKKPTFSLITGHGLKREGKEKFAMRNFLSEKIKNYHSSSLDWSISPGNIGQMTIKKIAP